MLNRKLRLVIVAILIPALGVMTANVGAQDPAPSSESQSPVNTASASDSWLRINAFTDIPLAGADIAVYDTAGNLLFERHRATNSHGVFPALVSRLPRDFRVTVAWDWSRRGDLDRITLGWFKLSADVRDFDPEHGIVYVNPVTTIVSRVMDKFPHLELQDAQALVRRFLGLPVNASLGAALRQGRNFRSRYFSQSAFLKQARRNGGVEAFLEQLVVKMLRRPHKTHSFVDAPSPTLGSSAPQSALLVGGSAPQSALLGGIASFVARNLAQGALSWAAGQGMGWAAQSAGLITPGATAADIANLQAGLADLQSSVDELSSQMAALTQQVLAKLTQVEYTQAVVPALGLAGQVDGVASDLSFFALGCPALPETGAASTGSVSADFCSQQKVTITAELNNPAINQSFGTLSSWVLDNPAVGYNGMIHLFSQALGETVRFFRPADSAKVQNMFDYWDAVLTQAASLKVELLHLNGAQSNPGGVAQLTSFLGDVYATPPTLGTFQNTHNSALSLMFPPVPEGTVINTKDRTMWATDYPVTAYFNCLWSSTFPPYSSTSINPVYGNLDWNGMHGWTSPGKADFQNLIDGWGGGSPMSWLIDQTKAVDPDSPTSPGFPNILKPPYGCPPNGLVWTNTYTGKDYVDSGGKHYPIYNLFDVNTGKFNSEDGQTGWLGVPYWVFLFRGLDQKGGEQYYWYP